MSFEIYFISFHCISTTKTLQTNNYILHKYLTIMLKLHIVKLQQSRLIVKLCSSASPVSHIIPQVTVGPNLFSDHMGELLGLQQPEMMMVHVLLLSPHLDPKQVVWVQVTNYSKTL
jgi:hypothetical protein